MKQSGSPPESGEHGQHEGLPVSKVHDLHHTSDQAETSGDQGIDKAHEECTNYRLDNDLGAEHKGSSSTDEWGGTGRGPVPPFAISR